MRKSCVSAITNTMRYTPPSTSSSASDSSRFTRGGMCAFNHAMHAAMTFPSRAITDVSRLRSTVPLPPCAPHLCTTRCTPPPPSLPPLGEITTGPAPFVVLAIQIAREEEQCVCVSCRVVSCRKRKICCCCVCMNHDFAEKRDNISIVTILLLYYI